MAAVIVICEEGILIWAIPPLLPQPPDFSDDNPTHIPPLFTIPFPDGIVLHPELAGWKTISSWYFGSSQPLYFDMRCPNRILRRLQIMLESDLSTASLQVINASEVTPYNFNHISLQSYRICEDTLVACLIDFGDHGRQFGVYTGLTSVPPHGPGSPSPAAKMLLPDVGHTYNFVSCPASGRFIALLEDNSVVVLDIF